MLVASQCKEELLLLSLSLDHFFLSNSFFSGAPALAATQKRCPCRLVAEAAASSALGGMSGWAAGSSRGELRQRQRRGGWE